MGSVTMHIGTAGFARRRERYAKKLAFVEIALLTPVPNPRAVAAWRAEVGDALVFAIVAPQTLWGDPDWPLRDDKLTQAEMDRVGNVARALQPRAIVLRTPRSVRPGTPALARFLAIVDRAKRLAPICVWDPIGVWERDAARAVASPAGLIVASDPLRESVAGEPVVYARMRGLGSDRRYHTGKLEDLNDALHGAQEAFVVFDTQNGFTEAVRFARITEGAEDDAPEAREAGAYGPDEEDEEGYGVGNDEDEDEADAEDEA